jgi:hypothetical protein
MASPIASRQEYLTARPKGNSRFIWFIWFVSFIWLNQTNQINQSNQRNQINQPVFARRGYRALVVDFSTCWWISTTSECATSVQGSALQGILNCFPISILARALRFWWAKNS